MTRTQWLVVAFIGVVAVIAYGRSNQIAKYLGISGTPEPARKGVNV